MAQKPPRAQRVRARNDGGNSSIRPHFRGYPWRAAPGLFGVHIDYDRKEVGFYDPYSSSDQATLDQEANLLDIVVMSMGAAEGSARALLLSLI